MRARSIWIWSRKLQLQQTVIIIFLVTSLQYNYAKVEENIFLTFMFSMSVSLARTQSFCRLGELFYKPRKWVSTLVSIYWSAKLCGHSGQEKFAEFCLHDFKDVFTCLAKIFFNFELFQCACCSLEANYAQNFKFGLHIIALVASIWSLCSYTCIFSKLSFSRRQI